MKDRCLLKVEYLLNRSTYLKVHTRVFTSCAHAHARIFTKINLVVSNYLMNLILKFRKDPCFRWGDIQLLVTIYIWYYTLNYSQFLTKNFDFLGHFLENVFTYSWYATFHWKNAKGFVHFFEKMSPGERPLWTWFGDIRLIGMYFLVDSIHMYWCCMP